MVLCMGLLAALTARADSEPPLLSSVEIAKSTLTFEQKRIAVATLTTESMINCFSAKEQLGSDFERLRIYHLASGENVAVFKSMSGIRIFVDTDGTPDELAEEFRTADSSTFSNVGEDDVDLELDYGRVMPGVGKTATALMQDPEYESELVCFLKQVPAY